jgi:two-component system chemotaxis response regulator CheY
MKALVADDEPLSRIVVERILSTYATVESYANGQEAVEACQKALDRGEPFDLVCLDLNMPIMGGLDALRLIRQEDSAHGRERDDGTKIVITTSANDKNTITSAFREMCDAYLIKPIDGEELLDVMHCLFPMAEHGG